MIWLPRTKTSAGLSGGWRSFAIDQVSPLAPLCSADGLFCLPLTERTTLYTSQIRCRLAKWRSCPLPVPEGRDLLQAQQKYFACTKEGKEERYTLTGQMRTIPL